MGALPVVLLDERIEARLLLQDVRPGRARRLRLERQMQPLVRPFCSGWPGAIRSKAMPSRSHQTASLLKP